MARKRDKFLSVERVAELTALAVRTVRAGKCGTKELLRVELGGRLVFLETDVLAWIEKRIRTAREKKKVDQQPAQPSNVVPMRPRRLNDDELSEALKQIRKVK